MDFASQLRIGQHSDSAVLLLIRDDHLLKVTHQGAKLATHESCVAEHSLEFIIGICVAVRRGTEHRHTESRWSGRRNAACIGHEVNRDCSTVRGKSRMDFFEQPFASSHIKVMKEVCEKYQVVINAVIDLEGAAGDCAITIIYSRSQSIFLCYGENALPINGNHFSPFVASSNLNPIHPMTGSDVQHLELLFRPLIRK